ncbi:GNAT family N-acetyltransferase [Pseudonocardia nematodicida]|uniref:GNAT family N-acetyltransferase n=1 Tax=Pseudonocardia nematodicida TaxID=1206997 RepID=A0ABV1K9J8_9PSEU
MSGRDARIVTVRTRRLVLEPLTVEHAREAVDLLSAPSLHEFIGGEPPTLRDLVERYGRQSVGHSPDGTERRLNWMLRHRTDGFLVGTVQATVRDDDRADIAWVVGEPHQRRGYGTEAASAMTSWLFATGVVEVAAMIHPGNRPSEALARTLGLVPTDRTVDGERVWSATTARPAAPGPTGRAGPGS